MIRSRDDGRLLGGTGLGFESADRAMTGYVFAKEHRASLHVLEKCGFTRNAEWSQLTEFPNLAPGVLQEVLRYEMDLTPES